MYISCILLLVVYISTTTEKVSVVVLCMHDENGGGMIDGDTFVKSLHSILQSSLNSATGITTQRLF